MFSEDHCRKEQTSSAVYPQLNSVTSVLPTEANCVPYASGAQQKMDTVAYRLPNHHIDLTQSHLLTRISNGITHCSHGQQTLLAQQHLELSSKEGNFPESPNYTVYNRLQKSNPLLFHLLTANNDNDLFPLSQQSQIIPRPTASTANSMSMPSVSKQYLNDDQILRLIEKKLTIFRGQMKRLKEKGLFNKDSLNTEPTSGCSPQSRSAPKAPDGHILMDNREKEASDGSSCSSNHSRMRNDGTAMAKQSPEYVGIMLEAAAICSKKEGERQVVLQAPGQFAVEELVKQSPTLTLHYKPSSDYKSAWRNVDPLSSLDKGDLHTPRNVMNTVDNLPKVGGSSILNHSGPTSSAIEISGKTGLVGKDSEGGLPQTSGNSEDTRTQLVENSSPNTDFADKSSGLDGNVKIELEQESTEETQEKALQKWEGKTEKDDEELNKMLPISDGDMSLLSKDINADDHTVQQIRHLGNASPAENANINLSMSQFPKINMFMQSTSISNDEGPVPGSGCVQVEISRLSEKNSKLEEKCCMDSNRELVVQPSQKKELLCVCPYYVEIDDELVQRPCPKCVQDKSSLNQEEHLSRKQESGSEDCERAILASGLLQHNAVMDPQCDEDEWFVVPLMALDVKLEEEIVVLDDIETDHEENGYPLNLEQPNSSGLPYFRKIKEFDSFDSFLQSKSKQFNFTFPLKAISAVPSEHLSPNCLLPKETVKVPELASSPCAEAEDSCDTDDSCDYPLQTTRNCLTVPDSLMVLPCLSCSPIRAEEPEMPQPPETITPRLPPKSTSINTFFPDLTSDEDEDYSNNAGNSNTVSSTETERLHKETFPIKESTKCHQKNNKKRRLKPHVIYSDDSDDELKQACERNYSSVSGEASTQSKQPARLEQNDKISESSKASSQINQSQVHKRKSSSTTSTSDHSGKRKRRPVSDKPQSEVGMSRLKPRATLPIPKPNPDTHKVNTNAPEIRKQNSSTQPLYQPLSNQSISSQKKASSPIKAPFIRGAHLVGTLSLDGESYQASSLPGCRQGQPKPKMLPKPHQGNAYSPSSSAKKAITKNWQNCYVPLNPQRSTCSANADKTVKTANKDYKIPKRPRHNSQELDTPLMKKTKSEAKQLTQHAYRQAPPDLNRDKTFSGRYKWGNSKPSNDLDWDKRSPDHPKGLTEH